MIERKSKLSFVRATGKDVDILFEWTNDPTVREQSLSNHTISHEEHINWFANKLTDKNCYLYIVYKNEMPAGMIRFDVQDNKCTLSYLVDKSQRGKGIGTEITKQGIKKFLNESAFCGVISAVVKASNISSIKIFEKEKFERDDDNKNLIHFKKLVV